MGIYIKGMEMPKSCDVCCFDLFVESCPLYNATPEDLVGITWIKKARHRYCPLVELPPHGRLIDIEPFMRGLYEEIQVGEITYTSQEIYDMMDNEIKSMPTIIEAEEGE